MYKYCKYFFVPILLILSAATILSSCSKHSHDSNNKIIPDYDNPLNFTNVKFGDNPTGIDFSTLPRYNGDEMFTIKRDQIPDFVVKTFNNEIANYSLKVDVAWTYSYFATMFLWNFCSDRQVLNNISANEGINTRCEGMLIDGTGYGDYWYQNTYQFDDPFYADLFGKYIYKISFESRGYAYDIGQVFNIGTKGRFVFASKEKITISVWYADNESTDDPTQWQKIQTYSSLDMICSYYYSLFNGFTD